MVTHYRYYAIGLSVKTDGLDKHWKKYIFMLELRLQSKLKYHTGETIRPR